MVRSEIPSTLTCDSVALGVQDLLGHSSPTVTLTVYSHYFSKTPTDAIQKLAGAILGTDPHRHKRDTSAQDGEVANAAKIA